MYASLQKSRLVHIKEFITGEIGFRAAVVEVRREGKEGSGFEYCDISSAAVAD